MLCVAAGNVPWTWDIDVSGWPGKALGHRVVCPGVRLRKTPCLQNGGQVCGCERWGIRAGTIGWWCRSPGRRPGGARKHLFQFVLVIAPPSLVITRETPQTFLDFGK